MFKQRLSNVQAVFVCVLVTYGCIWGAFVLLATGCIWGASCMCFGSLGVHVEGKVEGNAGGNAEGNAKGNAKGLFMVSTPARGVMLYIYIYKYIFIYLLIYILAARFCK